MLIKLKIDYSSYSLVFAYVQKVTLLRYVQSGHVYTSMCTFDRNCKFQRQVVRNIIYVCANRHVLHRHSRGHHHPLTGTVQPIELL